MALKIYIKLLNCNFFPNNGKENGHEFGNLHYLIVNFGTLLKVIENGQLHLHSKSTSRYRL
jgi:hypothetical protein